ncbi:MAG TPA: hypothetical protein VL179_11405, partial [Mycobacterium sp.]|nr:hypothetical protein [Mycobacterium sp.]
MSKSPNPLDESRRSSTVGGADEAARAARRSRRARIAAHASWAATPNRAARTAAGTEAFLRRFERQVDPDGVLAPQERRRMAIHARTAYMLQLAERSARARARQKRR